MTDAKLRKLVEIIERWAWQGDPELITDAHWDALADAREELGMEDEDC